MLEAVNHWHRNLAAIALPKHRCLGLKTFSAENFAHGEHFQKRSVNLLASSFWIALDKGCIPPGVVFATGDARGDRHPSVALLGH